MAKVEDAPEPLRLRRPLLHPSRWPVAVGLAMVVPGIFAPWREIAYPVGRPDITTGTSGGDAPGLQVLVFAAATALVCALPSVAGSRTRTVQLLPLLGGATALLVAIRSYLTTAPGGPGDLAQSSRIVVEWGMWAVLGGSALIALGGLATTLIIARDRPLVAEPWEPKPDLSFAPPLIAALTGFALAVAGVEAVAPFLPPGYQLVAFPLLLFGAVVAAFGIYGLFGLIKGAAAGRRHRTSARTGHDLPELEPLRRQRRR
jgi:hypothetical protein